MSFADAESDDMNKPISRMENNANSDTEKKPGEQNKPTVPKGLMHT